MSGRSKSNHRRWWLWTPLLAGAAWLAFFGDKSPANDAAAVSLPTRAAPQRAAAAAKEPAAARDNALLALLPREQLIPQAPASGTSAATRDLFSVRSWTPAPPAPAATPAAAPVAPPLPYVFVGKKLEGETWEVYLTRGDQTLVARAGETLEGSYRVESIQPPNLSLTYLPLGQVQTLAIGDTR